MFGPSGQWVRTRNDESAKAFIDERRSEDERRAQKVYGRRRVGRLPWILLAVIVIAALIVFLVSAL